jgi:glucosamine-6-phosphate deaminase
MNIILSNTRKELGKKAAIKGAELIKQAISKNGAANIIVATGASQFDLLDELTRQDLDWTKVTGFHLDEYIGIKNEHPASFCRYLKERFVQKISLKEFHYISGVAEPQAECHRLANILRANPVDVAFIGIGENGHLAFNDPPADFETEEPYIIVNLDNDCRQQQVGEGWFKSMADVPEKAISMSIKQIMKSGAMICCVPDERKANAVFNTLNGKVDPSVPASVLTTHDSVWLFLDNESASLVIGEK